MGASALVSDFHGALAGRHSPRVARQGDAARAGVLVPPAPSAGLSSRPRSSRLALVDERYEPTTIDVARDEGVTITFVDGHVARFDLPTLRAACPCAFCRRLRDEGEVAWPRPGSPAELRIEDAELHGGWGLRITWNDGHSTGIFPFDALRRWDEGSATNGADSGLGRGVN